MELTILSTQSIMIIGGLIVILAIIYMFIKGNRLKREMNNNIDKILEQSRPKRQQVEMIELKRETALDAGDFWDLPEEDIIKSVTNKLKAIMPYSDKESTLGTLKNPDHLRLTLRKSHLKEGFKDDYIRYVTIEVTLKKERVFYQCVFARKTDAKQVVFMCLDSKKPRHIIIANKGGRPKKG